MDGEQLSALLDGECHGAELDSILRKLDRDPALRRQLSRLALAQAAQHSLPVRKADLDFAERVRAALPARPDAAAPVSTASPAPTPVRTGSHVPLLALAATVAFAVIGLFALRPQPTDVAPAVEQVATAEAPPAQLDEQGERQLRRYLITYSESRAQAMGGTLGYARYAAYSSDTVSHP